MTSPAAGASAAIPPLFLQPATDPADARKSGQRLDGGVHIGGLAVVDEGHATDFGHPLAPMGQPFEAVKSGLDLFRRQPQRAAGAIGAGGILVVMRAGQAGDRAQIDGGNLPSLAHLRQPALARHQIPAGTRQLGLRDTDHARIARPFGQLVCDILPLDLVHADHGAIRPTLRKKPPLGCEIAAHAAVAVQMIGRQVDEHRHIGRQRAGKLDLVGTQLQHHHATIFGRVDIQHTAPDIAGQLHGPPRDLEDMGDERRGGGFPV